MDTHIYAYVSAHWAADQGPLFICPYKAQTVTRLLLFRGKSSEPSFPSFCVYVISVTHDCSTPIGRRLHPAVLDCSGSDTPLLNLRLCISLNEDGCLIF